jgi:hypothetical protein
MKRIIYIFIFIFFASYVKAQTAYDETEPITNLPAGIYYQYGPGDNNTINWTYPYTMKLTVNANIARNFEISTAGKENNGFIIRQFSQTTNNWTGWKNFILDDGNGNVGIGTNKPNQKLEIAGNIRLNTATSKIEWNGNTLQLGNYSDGIPVIQLRGSANYNPRFDIRNAGNTATVIQFNAGGDSYINTGNVGIGTNTPSYKLDVEGTIRANEIKVNLTGADFVFEPDYQLTKLEEIEKYVQKNKHLPGIESAAEMKEQGTALGELNTKLLQKVEELTLYLIEQEKEIKKLRKEIEAKNSLNK